LSVPLASCSVLVCESPRVAVQNRFFMSSPLTIYSGRVMSIDAEMLAVFKNWRQQTQFAADSDWIFASPAKLGRLPLSYPHVWVSFQDAATKAGIGKLATHTMRHTYRSWLDAAGTPIAVQQKLMRHSDIRTTMNVYGDVVTDEMSQAHSKLYAWPLQSSKVSSGFHCL